MIRRALLFFGVLGFVLFMFSPGLGMIFELDSLRPIVIPALVLMSLGVIGLFWLIVVDYD